LALASVGAALPRGGIPSKQMLAAVGFWLLALVTAAATTIYLAHRRTPPALVKPGSMSSWRIAFVSFFVIFISVSFLARVVAAAGVVHRYRRTMNHYRSLLAGQWISENTSKDSVLMGDQCALLHGLTGRKCVGVPATTDPRLVAAIIAQRRIGFLVVEDRKGFRRPDSRDLVRVLRRSNSDSLERVARGPGYVIYRVAPE